jgi:glycosyltransferase involved in cell wall biosynthesis
MTGHASHMGSAQPVVSVGLPVYNGGSFLEETIESILGQTFTDLELIISDNASTDDTEKICRRVAERDSRIRYYRNPENLGAARNFNIAVELARGRYFKWQGHDDPIPPDFLEHCVAVLDDDPSVVLAYGRQIAIDEHGRSKRTGALVTARLQKRSGLASRHALVRYWSCVAMPVGHPVGPAFGVIRRDVLSRTPLLGAFISADLPLMAELTLHGRFHQFPNVAQFRRYHAEQGHRMQRTLAQRESWFEPSRVKLTTRPRVRLLREHILAVRRATKHPGVRAGCYAGTVLWFFTEVLGIRPAKSMFRGLYQRVKPRQPAAEHDAVEATGQVDR